MARPRTPSSLAVDLDDLTELLPDWERHLRARNRAPLTIQSYLYVATSFLTFLTAQGMPTAARSITREHIEHYLVQLQERKTSRKGSGGEMSAANVAKHYRSLQQLFRWLHETEGEIEQNPFAKMQAPAVPEKPVDVLSEDQLRALLAVCKGKSFYQLRDRALILLFLDTGARCDELASLTLADLDFDADVAHVLGKGRRSRAVPFGATTGEALRRYLRARAREPLAAGRDAVWIGRKGTLTQWGIRQMMQRRAADAGVPDVHPHKFRHTFAHRWLAEGGQEQDLMRLAGWRSREMLGRYGASAADERARDAHRRNNSVDRLV